MSDCTYVSFHKLYSVGKANKANTAICANVDDVDLLIVQLLERYAKQLCARAHVCIFFFLVSFQIGIQASASVSVGNLIGDEIEVVIEEAHPRDDVLSLKEVQVDQGVSAEEDM